MSFKVSISYTIQSSTNKMLATVKFKLVQYLEMQKVAQYHKFMVSAY